VNLPHKAALAAIAAVLIYQLMIPPIVGLADQGDYARLIGPLHLGPTVKKFEERYYGFLNRTYQHDTTFRIRGWEGFTTQYIFVLAAMGVNKAISRSGQFDIRVLGALHILAFLMAAFFILRAARRLVPGRAYLLVPVAFVLVFCDVGYVSYFNSFFYEPASYLFLLGLLAVWLDLIAFERQGTLPLALFGTLALLFTGAKPQNVVAGLVLAVFLATKTYAQKGGRRSTKVDENKVSQAVSRARFWVNSQGRPNRPPHPSRAYEPEVFARAVGSHPECTGENADFFQETATDYKAGETGCATPWLAYAFSAALVAASIAMYAFMPRLVRLSPVYDMVFMTILPQASDPAAELQSLGLDPKYAKYSGTAAFAPNTAFWYADFQNQLDQHVNHFKIVAYYLRHPSKFLYYLRGNLPRSAGLRAEVSGNFEASTGYPPMARSQAFAVWSRFRGETLAPVSSGLLIALMLSVPVSFWMAVSSAAGQKKMLAECYFVLSLLAVGTFFTTVLGDALDMVKHLFITDILMDICLVFLLTTAAAELERRWTGLPLHYFNRDRGETTQAHV